MSAYAALVSLMHTIDDLEHHHAPPISLEKQQVESLTENITFLQEFLELYNSPVADCDEADQLEMRIADAAYAAEDVIESHIVGMINRRRPITARDRVTSFVGSIISRFIINCSGASKKQDNIEDEQIRCTNFYRDLQKVIEEMDLIKKAAMDIDTEKVVVNDQRWRSDVSSSGSVRSSSSTMECSDGVLLGILERLIGDGQRDCQIIPIVGMGGIGKTTLAKNIFARPDIKEHFDICAWATVSQQYNTRELICELLSQATNRKKEKLSESSESKLRLELYQYLCGRRFLIVMDDMWSIAAWEKIQHCFPNNDNGSRIMVTTRLSELSSKLNDSYSLHMEFLDEVRSWDLFSKTVFGDGSCPLQLRKIGKKMVDNCRGLPLSIVVVGGMLRRIDDTRECWESLSNNLNSVVNLDNEKHCLRLLKKSYNHLPVYLKPCFLYMGLFEEDDKINVSTLIKLWISEGFLKPKNNESLKTLAIGFLKDLVDRNLILVDRLGSNGNIKYCKIHDLLRDLCLKESEKSGFYHIIGQGSSGSITSQRRVVIPRKASKKKLLADLNSMPHARSVICEYVKLPRCRNLRLLRILHAHKFSIYEDQSYVHSRVPHHVNLRHLDIRVRNMSSFFSSLELFWNLQTLIVYCVYKCTLPAEIWKMRQLRHIKFVKWPFCLPDPPMDGLDLTMENLEILEGVQDFKCGEDVVKRIPNIKKLKIRYYGLVEGDEYSLSRIELLCKLESLVITCGFKCIRAPHLHTLSFPQSLKSLSLAMKSEFEWEEILEKIGRLPLLEKLQLWMGRFGTFKWEIVAGQFPCLKYLGLFECSTLKEWIVEESSMLPRLELLLLFGLRNLEEIPYEIGNIPTLQKIYMAFCSESAVKSAEEMVEEQGEELPFDIEVWPSGKIGATESQPSPNFINVYNERFFYNLVSLLNPY